MDKHTSSSSVLRQLQIVFTLSIGLLILSSVASFYSNKELISTSKLVNHTNSVIIELDNLRSIVTSAETGQRGFIISNNRIFLDLYEGAYEKALASHKRIKDLTSDNAIQQRNLDTIKTLIDQRFRQMRTVIELANGTRTQNRSSLFTDNAEMIKGKKIMEQLRAISVRIKQEEDRLLKSRMATQAQYIRLTPIILVIAALISIAISIVAYLRIKSDLDERVRKQKEDEAKYLETQDRIARMESLTSKIAKGDYKVRSKDVAKDELGRIGIALNEMADSLEQNFNELERRNWLQTGTAELNTAVLGQKLITQVSSKIISAVTNYLNAPIGTVYIYQNLQLKFAAGYGISQAPELLSLKNGGLIGQVAQDRKLLVINNVPDHYTTIQSSVGQARPTHLVIFPCVYDRELVGVIEIGLLRHPESLELDYLRANAENIAISLNTAVNFERTQELLEETQSQSEELQAQHSELENINIELEAQTQKLQASEEELKVQQEELQQANQELEERTRALEEKNLVILERNLEVQKKAEELALSTKYKSEFLANMSHELRTPLNSILLLSRLLDENAEKNLTEEQREYARVIQSSGNGLLSLIDEILDLSKIEAGKMDLEYHQVNLTDVRESMRGIFEPISREKGLAFKTSSATDLPSFIETDKLRLEQVLKNLLSNAIKFTASGSVSLEITHSVADSNFISFIVKDTGIGIPAEKQQLIFEAFQQADGSTRRKYGGTGLGLSISRELVKLLGGTIEVQSTSGEGSVFTISIPKSKQYHPNKDADTEQPAEIAAPEAKGARLPNTDQFIAPVIPESIEDDRTEIKEKDKFILIIEDDVNFAKSLRDYTQTRGYKAVVAVRGDEGILLAKQLKPTGILLDLQLPVKSGWEVMEELKNDPATRHIPVHIMSSHHQKTQSLQKGALAFIDKPVAFEQMQEIFTRLEHALIRDGKKVLIIEENTKHAKALAHFLETFHINSEVKSDIADGVQALKQEADCVILDMGIPDRNAYEMLEKIKKNPGLEDLPIIIFTGRSLSMAEEQRIKLYADSIVVKTAHSYQRVLDEISLFLHLVEENSVKKEKKSYARLGMLNEVLKNKTVLIVDDDVRNIFSLSKSLEALQMNIVTAIDGKEALQKLKENKHIDIVLLDMMMPELDGYETAKTIRKNIGWRNLPIIAVTAKAMTGDREKCINAGASDYITKPVDIDQLISLLRVWLYDN